MREAARWVMRGAGALVVAAGVVHLAMTGHLMHWFSRLSQTALSPTAEAAMLLNHLAVGILLMPLGVGLWAGAGPLARGEAGAAAAALSASGAVLALPFVVWLTATPEMLGSAGFVSAVVMLTTAAAALLWATLLLMFGGPKRLN